MAYQEKSFSVWYLLLFKFGAVVCPLIRSVLRSSELLLMQPVSGVSEETIPREFQRSEYPSIKETCAVPTQRKEDRRKEKKSRESIE